MCWLLRFLAFYKILVFFQYNLFASVDPTCRFLLFTVNTSMIKEAMVLPCATLAEF